MLLWTWNKFYNKFRHKTYITTFFNENTKEALYIIATYKLP